MRWGLAGYGDLPSRRLVAALRAAGQQPVAVWGRNPRRARTFADEHGIDHAASGFAELCREVEAVYVALPVSAHVPAAAVAVQHGCHVLVEKPLNVGLHPVDGIRVAADRAGVTIGVAYYRRLAPVVRRIAGLLEAGELGALRRVDLSFRANFDPSPEHPMYWRTRLETAGAGVLADAGSHRIDLLNHLLGPSTLVGARLEGFFVGGAEREAAIRLRWPEGVQADCRFSWAGGAPRDRLELEFEAGSVEVDPLDAGALVVRRTDRVTREHHPLPANPHIALIADFVLAQQRGRDPICPLESALWTDALIGEALEAGTERAPQPRCHP